MKLKRVRKKLNARQVTAGEWGFRRLFEETDRVLSHLDSRMKRIRRKQE